MLCEKCKIREANIQYTEVINGVKTEHHFCTQCAKDMDFGQYSAIFDGEFPLVQLLSGLLGGEAPVQRNVKSARVVCPTCGTTYEEFVKNSCFGCQDCYSVFDLLIHENIKKLQGSDCHKGKRPVNGPLPDQQKEQEALEMPEIRETPERLLVRWQRKLKEALEQEDYETAAVCRDQIRDLKKEMEQNG